MSEVAQESRDLGLATAVFDALLECVPTRSRSGTGAPGLPGPARGLPAAPPGLEESRNQLQLRLDELSAQVAAHDADAALRLEELFAEGFVERLAQQPGEQRLAWLARQVHPLAWLETRSPMALLPSLWQRLPAEERGLAAEVLASTLATMGNRLAGASLAPEPWLLGPLLDATTDQALEIPLDAQTELVQQADLVLQEVDERWSMVRRVIAECRHPLLLRYLCSSPAMFGADELTVRLLARGSHRHISCGLYALHLAPGRAPEVTVALIRALELQGPEQALPRILDIYAQSWLDRGEPEMLRAALLRWVADKLAGPSAVASTWLNALQTGLARDPRLFRQLFLVADLADFLRYQQPALAAQLYQELLRGFFACFTPAGVRHPLADSLWRARLGDALAEAAEVHPELVERLEAFGLQLPERAARWPLEQAGATTTLASLFLRTFGNTLCNAARALGRRRHRQSVMQRCYAALARVLTTHRRLAGGAGAFGALEHLLPVDAAPEAATPELLQRAAQVEQRALDHASLSGRRVRWLPASVRDELRSGTASSPMLATLGRGPAWEGQPLWAARLPASRLSSPLRTLLGLDALITLLLLPLRLLGYQRLGEIALESNHLVFRRTRRLLGWTFDRQEERLPLDGMQVELRALPEASALRAAGWAILILGTVLGTLLLHLGLEQPGFFREALQGLVVILVSLFYDASCQQRARQSREEGFLLLTPIGRSSPVALLIQRYDWDGIAVRLGA